MRTILTALAVVLGLLSAPASATPATCTPAPFSGGVAIKSKPSTYRRATVWVYGDSITVQTRPSMGLARSAVDAHSGRNTRQAVKALKADLKAHAAPATVVMATGTNDRLDPRMFRWQVARILKLADRHGFRVYWVNVATTTGADPAPINTFLAASPVRVIDWAATMEPDELADGIHVNASGCAARNALIRGALR